MSSGAAVWLSLDPVRKKIDFYPSIFGSKIEHAYAMKKEVCVLGSDFFGATVHLNSEPFQTTPGHHFGRSGFKQPGFRTVRRISEQEMKSSTLKLFAKRIHGEWRLCDSSECEHTFVVTIPDECIVDINTTCCSPRVWTTKDLTESENGEQPVIIWQWCTTVSVTMSNLTDDMWHSYVSHPPPTLNVHKVC